MKNVEKQMKIDDSISVICQEMGLSYDYAKCPNRKREVVDTRHLIARILKDQYDLSAAEIAPHINRSRSNTVISLRNSKAWVKINKTFREKYTRVKTALENHFKQKDLESALPQF